MEMVTTIIREKTREEKRTTRNVIFRIFLVIVSIAALLAFLRPVLSDFYAGYYRGRVSNPNEKNIMQASRITNEDAGYHYLSGLLHYTLHGKEDIKKAIDDYLLALKRNPTDSRVWLAIAKAYRDIGMEEYAEHAIRRAVYMDKNDPGLVWESGVFFLHLNKPSVAIQYLRRYIFMVPSDQDNVYSLCYAMGVRPIDMLDSLVPENYDFYKRYLDFLMSNRLSSDSFEVWKRLKKFKPERGEYLKYCDFLIGVGETEEAEELWKEFAKRFAVSDNRPSGEMIWNGDFELPFENGGFDWRIGTSQGVRVFRDKDIKWTGFASLSVNFDGKTNPGLYIARQIVPVSPGRKYRLSGYIRTEGITTLNGIILEVSNLVCDPFAKTTEPVTGTNLWKKMEIEFTAPNRCRTVSIGIKREQSGKFDNKISGDAWIDSMSMAQTRN